MSTRRMSNPAKDVTFREKPGKSTDVHSVSVVRRESESGHYPDPEATSLEARDKGGLVVGAVGTPEWRGSDLLREEYARLR